MNEILKMERFETSPTDDSRHENDHTSNYELKANCCKNDNLKLKRKTCLIKSVLCILFVLFGCSAFLFGIIIFKSYINKLIDEFKQKCDAFETRLNIQTIDEDKFRLFETIMMNMSNTSQTNLSNQLKLFKTDILSDFADIRIQLASVKKKLRENNFLTLTGHTNPVYALAVLQNGDLASGSADDTIKIWHTTNGTVKQTLTGHTNPVYALTVLQNGDLASGSADDTIKIWNSTNGTVKQTLTGHSDWVRALTLLQNGDLASGSADETIKIWDTTNGTVKQTLTGHINLVYALTVLQIGDLASGSDDATIKIWYFEH